MLKQDDSGLVSTDFGYRGIRIGRMNAGHVIDATIDCDEGVAFLNYHEQWAGFGHLTDAPERSPRSEDGAMNCG
ncbi:MAG: hypothetical protein AAGA44_11290 [Pseudomonadota bacterium]